MAPGWDRGTGKRDPLDPPTLGLPGPPSPPPAVSMFASRVLMLVRVSLIFCCNCLAVSQGAPWLCGPLVGTSRPRVRCCRPLLYSSRAWGPCPAWSAARPLVRHSNARSYWSLISSNSAGSANDMSYCRLEIFSGKPVISNYSRNGNKTTMLVNEK